VKPGLKLKSADCRCKDEDSFINHQAIRTVMSMSVPYKVMVDTPEAKEQFGRLKLRWENNI
jgi:hypothetical protein